MWLGMKIEIRRAADNDDAHVGCNADCDHVLGHVVSQTNADVEALGHDVGEAVVAADFNLDIGVMHKPRQ